MAQRTRYSQATRLLVLLVAVALNLAVAEYVVRDRMQKYHDTGILQRQHRVSRIAHITRFSDDPELVYELRPSLNTTFADAPLHTCSDGRRIADPSRPPDPVPTHWPERRIAIVGDSNGFGWGVTHDQTYFEILRRNLQQKYRVALEVRNYSVPGYNTLQESLVFHRDVVPWKPDLVLWHYCRNDVHPIRRNSALTPEYGDNFLGSALWKTLARMRRHSIEEAMDPANRLLDGAIYRGPLYDGHMAALAKMAETAEQHDFPVAVFLFDTFFDGKRNRELYARRFHRPLKNRFQKYGLPFLDLYQETLEVMAERDWDDLKPWWISADRPWDLHANAEGQVFMAEELERFLGEQGCVRAALKR